MISPIGSRFHGSRIFTFRVTAIILIFIYNDYKTAVLVSSLQVNSPFSTQRLSPTLRSTPFVNRRHPRHHLPLSPPSPSSSPSRSPSFLSMTPPPPPPHSTEKQPQPPLTHRDENRTILAGAVPLTTTKQQQQQQQYPIRQSPTSTNKLISPPVPIPDPYGWLRDETRSDPAVLQHLRNENAYTNEITSRLGGLRDEIYNEMVGRLGDDEDDGGGGSWMPVEVVDDEINGIRWRYYTRRGEGRGYKLHCRVPFVLTDDGSDDGGWAEMVRKYGMTEGEEVYLDENELASGRDYCAVKSVEVVDLPSLTLDKDERDGGGVSHSKSRPWVFYTVDYNGDGVYQVYIKDITSGKIVTNHDDTNLECCGQILCHMDHYRDHRRHTIVSLFYVKMTTPTKRPYQVYRRRITIHHTDDDGIDDVYYYTDEEEDEEELIYEEKDVTFTASISKSSDGRYLLITSSSAETTEVHYLDLQLPPSKRKTRQQQQQQQQQPKRLAKVGCIEPRQPGVFYGGVDHWNGWWLVSTNGGGVFPNRRLMVAKVLDHDSSGGGGGVCWEDLMGTISTKEEEEDGKTEKKTITTTTTNNNNNNTKEPAVLFEGGLDSARSLDQIKMFRDHIVLSGREDGLPQIWVGRLSFSSSSPSPLQDNNNNNIDDYGSSRNSTVADELIMQIKSFRRLTFTESAYDVRIAPKGQRYDGGVLWVWYNSLTTPFRVLEVSLLLQNEKENKEDGRGGGKEIEDHNNQYNNRATNKITMIKETHVPNYNPSGYGYHRTTVLSRDGRARIPVSMVYRKDVMDGWKRSSSQNTTTASTVPVHLYGYGSYGTCCECDFNTARLPLMERGIVFVCAHVRGGGEMGHQWYEEGKYLCKKNTFNDFCDVAKWLIEDLQLTTSQQLSCEGASAGGLLIGGSINQNPDLFSVAILRVPFVDVVCTMVDSTLPLTCEEWEEWGNPNETKFFDYIMEYSPMNNVKPGGIYPACLVTGGLYDPSVQYWEPAKIVAELRNCHDPALSGPVCLKMDMAAGHFSSSDRYRYLAELAFDYAFLLDQMALVQTTTNYNNINNKNTVPSSEFLDGSDL